MGIASVVSESLSPGRVSAPTAEKARVLVHLAIHPHLTANSPFSICLSHGKSSKKMHKGVSDNTQCLSSFLCLIGKSDGQMMFGLTFCND